MLDGMHVLFIAQHPAPQRSLMVVSRVGARFPAYCTANGKALLAQLPADEVKRRLPKRLETPAKHTPISRKELFAELEAVRETGLAYDCEEHRAGICGVGVAVIDIDGSSASISVPMPAARFHEDPRHRRRGAAARARRGPGGPAQRLTRQEQSPRAPPGPSVVAVVGSPRRQEQHRGARRRRARGARRGRRRLRDHLPQPEVTSQPCFAHDALRRLLPRARWTTTRRSVLERVYAADCLLLGTPVYYENVSAQMKAFMDRNLFRYSHDAVVARQGPSAWSRSPPRRVSQDDARRAAALRRRSATEGEVPVVSCGGYAGDAGVAAGDEALLARGRDLGRALARELGLTPA